MAWYSWNIGSPLGAEVHEMVESARTFLEKAQKFTDVFNQMSNAQITASIGFSDGTTANDTQAGNAKAELLSDLGKVLTDGSQTGVNAALKQMLAQFAG